MNVFTELENKLYALVAPIFPDATIVIANQDGQEPSGSYGVIDVTSVDQVGREYRPTHSSISGQIVIRSEYSCITTFRFIGPSAGDLAFNFSASLDKPTTRELFDKQGIAIMQKGVMRRIPQKRETQWVNYFSMDVTMMFALDIPDTTEVITEVILSSDITP